MYVDNCLRFFLQLESFHMSQILLIILTLLVFRAIWCEFPQDKEYAYCKEQNGSKYI